MTFDVSDTVKDQSLNYLRDNVDTIVLLDADPGIGTGQPYTDATTNNGTSTGKRLASQAMVPGDFTVEDGATDGRKVTAVAKNDVSVVAPGDASHVAWLDSGASEVLHVTELTTVRTGLQVSDLVDIPSHFHAYRQPVQAT